MTFGTAGEGVEPDAKINQGPGGVVGAEKHRGRSSGSSSGRSGHATGQEEGGNDEDSGEMVTHRFQIQGELTLALEKLGVMAPDEEDQSTPAPHTSTADKPQESPAVDISANVVHLNGTRPSFADAASAPLSRADNVNKQSEQQRSSEKDDVPSPGQATPGEADTNATAPASQGLDLALIEALRVPRDRTFVLQYEREMESKIKDTSVQNWELPLMNSYQRLLVHRIADRFGLSHTIDATTKQVTLEKQSSTQIPTIDLALLGSTERLSEPASSSFPLLVNSLSSQKTSPNGTGSSTPTNFRIMRRETGSSAASRADSPRDSGGVNGNRRKDRRDMTIEEREAAYREARQRIFGNAEGIESSASSQKDPTQCAEGISGSSAMGRPGISPRASTGSGSSANSGNQPRLQQSLSSSATQAPLLPFSAGSREADLSRHVSNSQSLSDSGPATSNGDLRGDELTAQAPWQASAQHRPCPPPKGTPLYEQVVPSSSTSSRSTSVSADTEGGDSSTRSSSSESRQTGIAPGQYGAGNYPVFSPQTPHGGWYPPGTSFLPPNYPSQHQQYLPSAHYPDGQSQAFPYQHCVGLQAYAGAVGDATAMMVPASGQSAFAQRAQGHSVQSAVPYVHSAVRPQTLPSYMASPMTSHGYMGASPAVQQGRTHVLASPDAIGRGRGRQAQGTQRLFDPSKPLGVSGSSRTSSGTTTTSSQSPNPSLSGGAESVHGAHRGAGLGAPTTTADTPHTERVKHPSLPARPDWVMAARRGQAAAEAHGQEGLCRPQTADDASSTATKLPATPFAEVNGNADMQHRSADASGEPQQLNAAPLITGDANPTTAE